MLGPTNISQPSLIFQRKARDFIFCVNLSVSVYSFPFDSAFISLSVYQSFLTQIFFRYLCFYSVVINVASLQKGELIHRKNVLHDQLAETKIFLRRFKSFFKRAKN